MFRRDIKNSRSIATAKSSIIKGSVQKVNLVLKLIRGKKALDAVSFLTRVQKYAAINIRKTLLSAISNAEQKGIVDIENLIIKKISAGKTIKLRRFQPRARGRIFTVNKHYSKIYVELHEEMEA